VRLSSTPDRRSCLIPQGSGRSSGGCSLVAGRRCATAEADVSGTGSDGVILERDRADVLGSAQPLPPGEDAPIGDLVVDEDRLPLRRAQRMSATGTLVT
jgi:hypothetical protein